MFIILEELNYCVFFSGERLRQDLKKKELLPAQKFALLEQKFDEVRDSGLMLATGTPSKIKKIDICCIAI